MSYEIIIAGNTTMDQFVPQIQLHPLDIVLIGGLLTAYILSILRFMIHLPILADFGIIFLTYAGLRLVGAHRQGVLQALQEFGRLEFHYSVGVLAIFAISVSYS